MTILGELVRRRRTPYLSPQSLRHYGYGWGGYDEDEPEEEEEEEEEEEREEEEEGPEEEEDDELGPYDQEGASKRNISGHKKASFRNCHLKTAQTQFTRPPVAGFERKRRGSFFILPSQKFHHWKSLVDGGGGRVQGREEDG